MYLRLLLLIPALVTILWAVAVKIRGRKIFDAITFVVCGAALAINGFAVYQMIQNGSCSIVMHFMQFLFSSSIVPLAYMYFSRQMGRRWNNATAVICWSLMLLILLPNVFIFLSPDRNIDNLAELEPFRVNLIRHGSIIFSCYTADLAIFIQAMLTALRMIPAARTLKKYGLVLSKKLTGFYLWWASAILFIGVTSFTPISVFSTPAGSWVYFSLYSALICSIFSMLALQLDLHPVVTEDEGEPVHVDTFIESSKSMADKLRMMMDVDKVFLRQGYSTEDMVDALNTNRTYFSRMMNAEFGMKFSDMLNDYRVEHAKVLLATTDMSISDVAFECGFSDASYMSKKFHQIVGESPSAFRG